MRTVVVGGGLSGIFSAILSKARGAVTLVEKTQALGGLLRSEEGPAGVWFDQGTHIPQPTGHPSIDEILFSSMKEPEWRRIDHVREGNYSFGSLDTDSPFPDLRKLPTDAYHAAIVELIDSAFEPSTEGSPSDTYEVLCGRFGRTATERLVKPMLERTYGRDVSELGPDSYGFFFSLLVGLSPHATRALKTIPAIDGRLAFHSLDTGGAPRPGWYPRTGGCGRWIADLHRERLAGVDIRLGSVVTGIESTERSVSAVELNGGETIAADEVIWTLPPALLASIRYGNDGMQFEPPTFLSTHLLHLIFDQPFLTDLHFVTCLDGDEDIFRITLYPNLRGEGDTSFACTMEVMVPPSKGIVGAEPDIDSAVEDLKRMRIVAPGARLVWSSRKVIEKSFPVPAARYADETRRIGEVATEGLENVKLLGRASGGAYYMSANMLRCHRELSR